MEYVKGVCKVIKSFYKHFAKTTDELNALVGQLMIQPDDELLMSTNILLNDIISTHRKCGGKLPKIKKKNYSKAAKTPKESEIYGKYAVHVKGFQKFVSNVISVLDLH